VAVVVVPAVVVMVDWSVDSYTQLEPMTTWRCLLLVADFCRTATEREAGLVVLSERRREEPS
jgi:hypothetical protein